MVIVSRGHYQSRLPGGIQINPRLRDLELEVDSMAIWLYVLPLSRVIIKKASVVVLTCAELHIAALEVNQVDILRLQLRSLPPS